MKIVRLTLVALLLAAPAIGEEPPEEAAAEPAGLGINLDLELSSAYIFRGENLFKHHDSEAEGVQHARVSPSITWSIADTGAYVGYWGGYQLNGGVSDVIDAGYGAEQDVLVGYGRDLPHDLNLGAVLTAYVYPLADPDVAGARWLTQLDLGVALTWSSAVDLALKVDYYHSLQEAQAVYRYTYLNPAVSRTFTVGAGELTATGAFGYKLYNDRDAVTDHVYDVLASAALRWPLGTKAYVKPSLSFSWSNAAEQSFLHEVCVWGAVNLGIDL